MTKTVSVVTTWNERSEARGGRALSRCSFKRNHRTKSKRESIIDTRDRYNAQVSISVKLAIDCARLAPLLSPFVRENHSFAFVVSCAARKASRRKTMPAGVVATRTPHASAS